MTRPQISIITVTYNSEQTLEQTLQSVFCQQGVDFEYIVVDGQSTDNTMRIVDSHRGKLTKVVSEPDAGVYDAMNKGIALAGGELICLLNSDDYFSDPKVLLDVWGLWQTNRKAIVYGDIRIVNKSHADMVVRLWKSGELNVRNLSLGIAPPHPGMFVPRTVYRNVGNYDIGYKIAADFDFFIRAFLLKKVPASYLGRCLVIMREGGLSSLNWRNRLVGWLELYHVLRTHKVSTSRWFIFYRLWAKLKQLV